MENIELVNETVLDLESCKEGILERHKDNPTFCLRIESVFNQLVNTLNRNTGILQEAKTTFEAKPISKIFGKEIKEKPSAKLNLKPIEVNEIEAFKEKINMIYESFPERETADLIESLSEVEIRGVAKLAGVPNYDKAKIDGKLIDDIKKGMKAIVDLQNKKDAEEKKLGETK